MDALGWIFGAVVCLLLPCLAVRTSRQLERVRPTLIDVLVSLVVTQAVLVSLAIAAAWTKGLRLFPDPTPGWEGAAWGSALFGAMIAASLLHWRVRTPEEKRRLAFLKPHSLADAPVWLAISLIAGFAEELVYRGVLFQLVEGLVVSWGPGAETSWWISAGVCTLAFAAGHWVQGWSAMAIIVGFALAMHALVRLTGDLYAAMSVHAAYDFAAGWLVLWLYRREGLDA